MKIEVVIDGRGAKLEVEANHLRYAPEGADAIKREFSIASLVAGSYSVLIGGRSYRVVTGVRGEIRVNGRAFQVDVFDPREMRGRKNAAAGEGRQKIVAMMPGKVVRVLVEQGDAVEAGQGLVVVEAMKMQNEMKSPKAGRVIEVKTRAEATVAAGEVLMVIE